MNPSCDRRYCLSLLDRTSLPINTGSMLPVHNNVDTSHLHLYSCGGFPSLCKQDIGLEVKEQILAEDILCNISETLILRPCVVNTFHFTLFKL